MRLREHAHTTARPPLRAALALVVAGAVLSGCEPSQPEPVPGPTPSDESTATATPAGGGTTVGVVLPPASQISDGEAQRLRVALAALEQTPQGGVAEVRVVRPDADAFRRDLAALLATDDTDLVCVLGVGSGAVVAEVAAIFPQTRFCAAPAAGSDLPGNVIAVDVRSEDIAFLAGLAARTAVGDAPVAVLGRAGDASLGVLRGAFDAGARHGGGDPASPLRRVAPSGGGELTDDDVEAVATAAFADGVPGLYAPVGAAAVGAVRAAAAALPVAPSPESTPRASPGGQREPVAPAAVVDTQVLQDHQQAADQVGLLLAVGPDYAAAVRRAAELVTTGESPAAVSMGIADGAVAVVRGGHPRAAMAFEAVQRARVEIITGSLAVPAPS